MNVVAIPKKHAFMIHSEINGIFEQVVVVIFCFVEKEDPFI